MSLTRSKKRSHVKCSYFQDHDSENKQNYEPVNFFKILCIASLQHDKLKSEFIEQNGLELLIKLTMKESFLDKNKNLNLKDLTEEWQNLCIENKIETELVQQLALECFFSISFNNEAAELLKKNASFINHVRNLINNNQIENIGLKKAADGIIWKLEKEEIFKKQQEEKLSIINNKKDEFDFMISYSWDDKPLAHKIYKYLVEDCNYRVWLDENEMAGSLCQAMAHAIEKSKFILMYMSEAYKTSANCRNEAEYARDRKKIIIPLKMKKVQLDDWLGFIVAGKMFIDFGKYQFEKSIQLLKVEIQRHQTIKQLEKLIHFL